MTDRLGSASLQDMRALLLISILFFVDRVLWQHMAFADSACFDLSKASVQLLKAAPLKFDPKTDLGDSGIDSNHLDWGQVSGVVHKPLGELYFKLQDPKTIRNSDNTKVTVELIETKEFLKKFLQKIVVKPVIFITIEWTEEWGFALKQGTPEKPEAMVISYQKSEGTSHIRHLCGNILLRALSPTSTGVFIYEEVQADRRNAKDVLNGITGTLRTLRE